MMEIRRDLDADRRRREELLEGVAGLRGILSEAMEGSRERLREQLEEEKAVRGGRVESVKRGIEAMLENVPVDGTLEIEDEESEEVMVPDPTPNRAMLLKQRALLLIASRGGGLPKVKTPPPTPTNHEIPSECCIQTPTTPTPRRKQKVATKTSPRPPTPRTTPQRGIEIVRSTQSTGEKERDRYKAALRALRKEAEDKQTIRERRKKELLNKAQSRIDKFCEQKGYPHSKEARSEVALKHATIRHKQLAEEREKEEVARQLREEYLARCKEDGRKQHLQEISEKMRRRPSPKKARTGSVQRKHTPTTPTPLTASPVWRNTTATPESSFEDVRRITVNLFDSIISEPTSPTRAGASS